MGSGAVLEGSREVLVSSGGFCSCSCGFWWVLVGSGRVLVGSDAVLEDSGGFWLRGFWWVRVRLGEFW